MKLDPETTIKEHTAVLEKIYKQRRHWLYASSIVYTAIILTIFSWDYLTTCTTHKVWWVLISLGLLVSVNWWYWTMRSIASVVRSVYSEYEILNEITTELRDIKEEVKNHKLD